MNNRINNKVKLKPLHRERNKEMGENLMRKYVKNAKRNLLREIELRENNCEKE